MHPGETSCLALLAPACTFCLAWDRNTCMGGEIFAFHTKCLTGPCLMSSTTKEYSAILLRLTDIVNSPDYPDHVRQLAVLWFCTACVR